MAGGRRSPWDYRSLHGRPGNYLAYVRSACGLVGGDVGVAIPCPVNYLYNCLLCVTDYDPAYDKKWLNREIVKTNADRLIGQTGVVTEKINRLEGVGQVKVAGQIWSAVPAAGNEIEPGTTVRIDEIVGVKLVVTQIET